MPITSVSPHNNPPGIIIGSLPTQVLGGDGKRLEPVQTITLPLTDKAIQALPELYSGFKDALTALRIAGNTAIQFVYDPKLAMVPGASVSMGTGTGPIKVAGIGDIPISRPPGLPATGSTIVLIAPNAKAWTDFQLSDLASTWVKADPNAFWQTNAETLARLGIISADDPRIVNVPTDVIGAIADALITPAYGGGVESIHGNYPLPSQVIDAERIGGIWQFPKLLGELVTVKPNVSVPTIPLPTLVGAVSPTGRAMTGGRLLGEWARDFRRWVNPLAMTKAGLDLYFDIPRSELASPGWNRFICRSPPDWIEKVAGFGTWPDCTLFGVEGVIVPGPTTGFITGGYDQTAGPDPGFNYWIMDIFAWVGPGVPTHGPKATRGLPSPRPKVSPLYDPENLLPGYPMPATRTIPYKFLPYVRPFENRVPSARSDGGYYVPGEGPPVLTARPLPEFSLPPPKTKYVKLRTKHGKAIMGLANQFTEVCDAIEAIHDALPLQFKARAPGQAFRGGTSKFNVKPTCSQQADAIYVHFNEVDWNLALVNLIKENLGDIFYGKQGQLSARVNVRLNRQSGVLISRMGVPQANI